MTKKILETFAISSVIILVASAGLYYFFFYKKPIVQTEIRREEYKKEEITRSVCLNDEEIAIYEIKKREKEISLADIIIKNKKSGEEIFRFQIELPMPGHYHPIELHKCGVYTTRSFNYDYIKRKASSDYRIELWRYQYDTRGESLVFLSGPISGSGFSTDFRIDQLERYLVLTGGYLGSPDYSIVIKDLKNLKDIFTLLMTEVEKQKPEIANDIVFEDWSSDGRYFWANFHAGANVLGYVRIDSTNWSFDLFQAPKDVLGGDALNLENGYITVHLENIWIGVAELEEEEKARRRAQGIVTELYIENLITEERHFVAKTNEPLWYFKPKWISYTELQYEMPNGEKQIYKIEE